jgi:hypothetical protein
MLCTVPTPGWDEREVRVWDYGDAYRHRRVVGRRELSGQGSMGQTGGRVPGDGEGQQTRWVGSVTRQADLVARGTKRWIPTQRERLFVPVLPFRVTVPIPLAVPPHCPLFPSRVDRPSFGIGVHHTHRPVCSLWTTTTLLWITLVSSTRKYDSVYRPTHTSTPRRTTVWHTLTIVDGHSDSGTLERSGTSLWCGDDPCADPGDALRCRRTGRYGNSRGRPRFPKCQPWNCYGGDDGVPS